MGQQRDERRRFPRAEIPCRIILNSSGKLFATHTVNISEGGIRVVLKDKIEALSLVDLELMIEENIKIKCKGKAAWVMEKPDPDQEGAMLYDTGFQLEEIRAIDKENLRTLVHKLVLKSSE